MPPKKNRKPQSVKKNDRALRAELNGGSKRVPNNPPAILLQPYYPITLQYTNAIGTSGVFQLFISDLAQILREQMTITGAVRLKVKSLSCWNLTAKELGVEFREMAPDGQNYGNSVLFSKTDYGSPITYPAVGYKWPASFANVPHSSLDPQTTIATVIGGANNQILYRVVVHWSLVPPTVLP